MTKMPFPALYQDPNGAFVIAFRESHKLTRWQRIRGAIVCSFLDHDFPEHADVPVTLTCRRCGNWYTLNMDKADAGPIKDRYYWKGWWPDEG